MVPLLGVDGTVINEAVVVAGVVKIAVGLVAVGLRTLAAANVQASKIGLTAVSEVVADSRSAGHGVELGVGQNIDGHGLASFQFKLSYPEGGAGLGLIALPPAQLLVTFPANAAGRGRKHYS
jgi:hypothetical protein